MRYWAGLLVACGCFSPSPPLHSPCPNGVCPSGLVCSPATMTCEDTAVDAAVRDTLEIDALPDGCYGSFVTVCPDGPITGNTQITINVPTSLSTTMSPLCVPYHLPSGAPDASYCVVAAKTITIGGLGRWNVTGTRPLVVIATSQLDISGTIDAASHVNGAIGPDSNPAACIAGTAPALDDGGPGGSFGTAGGSGGGTNGGPKVSAAPATAMPLALRGGCPGRGGSGANAGTGGRGGGAIYLIADMLTLDGTINASGAGGDGAGLSAGGGGGGSGGMIVLEAKMFAVLSSARIFANGGGGGEGGAGNPGDDGIDSTAPTTSGPGGSGGAGAGGDGGNGFGAAMQAGAGATDTDSGGGGGGGAGVIRVFPSQSFGGSISPPAS